VCEAASATRGDPGATATTSVVPAAIAVQRPQADARKRRNLIAYTLRQSSDQG
jgi:hypothetical protein